MEAVENTESQVQYAFILMKETDGKVSIKKVDGTPEANIQDIYYACESVCRNIRAVETANVVAAQMMQAATQFGADRTQGGVVLPHTKKVPKR